MSWKRGDRLSVSEGSRLSLEIRLWEGDWGSKGFQPISPDNLEGSFCPQCQPIWAGPSKRTEGPRGPMLQASKCCHISACWGAGLVWVGGWGPGSGWAFLTLEVTHLLVASCIFLLSLFPA